jgi:hypothetical protein
MKKEIIIQGINYEFWFDEELNMWRIRGNNSLIDSHTIDLEIDLANLGGTIDWIEIADFISSILGNRSAVNENIKNAQLVLWSYYKTIHKKAFDEEFFQDVAFDLTGIDYKGKKANTDSFMYDYFFFPQYLKDIYRDIGSVPYRANFRGQLFLGIYCDI